jgi:preprotein translocase subunit SecA
MRHEILQQEDISKRIKQLINDEAEAMSASPMLTSEDFEDVVREVFPLDEAQLDRLFDSEQSKFGEVLREQANELYEGRETAFTPDILRKVERDVYLQVLDNLWMQHLENMDHLREGIHWMSVGQQDPLVEYRRRAQMYFEEMQQTLRHDVLRALFHAQPVDESQLEHMAETELTRAARNSVDNVDQISDGDSEFAEADFERATDPVRRVVESETHKKEAAKRKKAHKTERKRKSQARKRK